MQTRSRSLTVDVCDYTKKVLCSIYDNKADISGQAHDVFINYERNGWKELSFQIPSMCEGPEGPEPNYRLDFLVADYKLRVVTDDETDWFLISEPKIHHDNFSKNVTVTANHIASLLKTKNLDLEFSDDEGNNVGTAEQFAEVILEGTGWSLGSVSTFYEDDGVTEKVRTMRSSVGTGSFKMMQDMCSLFDAKCIYHGEEKTVDILPINPFSETVEGQIPSAVLEGHNVLEIHYGQNTGSIERIQNTDNMVTKLLAYGSYGDMNGICGITTCSHNEYNFTIGQLAVEYCFLDKDELRYYFAPEDDLTGKTVIWSDLDFLSRSYVWCVEDEKAYTVYRKATTTSYENPLTAEPESVRNYFPYLFNFTYYQKVGLFTDEMLQEAAKYQREIADKYRISEEASKQMIADNKTLSEIGESNTGFLRLDIDSYANDNNNLKLIINKNDYPEGVIYRSDYDQQVRRYFQWHIVKELRPNGDPVSGSPSMILIVHDTDPVTYETAYLRKIDGYEEDYDYYLTGREPPSNITVWLNYASVPSLSATDRFYLFCTDSMSGSLGKLMDQKESIDSAVEQAVKEGTLEGSVTHPVYYIDKRNGLPDAPSAYGWCYLYEPFGYGQGDYYFCIGNGTTWKHAYIDEEAPETIDDVPVENGSYFYNLKYKTLWIRESGSWELLETMDDEQLARKFDSVHEFCQHRDLNTKGQYEEYTYTTLVDLPPGNYAFRSEYGYFYWGFSTDRYIHASETTDDSLYDHVSDDLAPFIDYMKQSQTYQDATEEQKARMEEAWELQFKAYLTSLELSQDKAAFIAYMQENTNYDSLSEEAKTAMVAYWDDQFDAYLDSYSLKNVLTLNTTGLSVNNTEDPSKIFKASWLKYDYLTFPLSNILEDIYFIHKTIDQETGVERDSNIDYASYNVYMYDDMQYEYLMPANTFVVFYDKNRKKIGYTVLTGDTQGSGRYTTPHNTYYGRFVTKTEPTSSHYVRIVNYDKKFFIDDRMYNIIGPMVPSQNLKGINNLMIEMADLADKIYLVDLKTLTDAQDVIKEKTNELADSLGELYREQRWQDSNYVEGDETRLYKDAMDNLKEIGQPDTTYNISFLDRFDSNRDMEYALSEESENAVWPDLKVTDAVHLVDPELDLNLWAYIDKLNKCFDKPWETSLEINTKLSLIGQHEFTDVMTRIAEVASETKAKQTIYGRAAVIGSMGQITSDRLEGTIQANKTLFKGGASSWFTDEDGAIIFESADGASAMKLAGYGFCLANTKNEYGEWDWRSWGTGAGFSADEIVTGFLSAQLIEAGTITVDKVSANFGQELDIGSNSSVMMFATVDGERPAGSLNTTDGFIKITAGKEASGQEPAVPARIDIAAGANGYGEINIRSGGKFYVDSSNFKIYTQNNVDKLEIRGKVIAESGQIAGFEIRAEQTEIDDPSTPEDESVYRHFLYYNTDSMESVANGIYLGDDGVNFGGKFKYGWNDNASWLNIQADLFQIGSGNSFIKLSHGLSGEELTLKSSTINITGSTDINISAQQTLRLLSNGGNVVIGSEQKPFTIGADSLHAYIYNGVSALPDLTVDPIVNTSGAYYGTDGLFIGQSVGNYVRATATGAIDISGKITAEEGEIGGWKLHDNRLEIYEMMQDPQDASQQIIDPETYVAMGMGVYDQYQVPSDYRIWAGDSNDATAPFSVKKDGTFKASKGTIANWNIDTNILWAGTDSSVSTDFVAMAIDSTNYGTGDYAADYRFWAGKKDPASAPFSVRKDGYLYASSGKVGGWNLTASKLHGTKVGLQIVNNDDGYAFWAGNDTASSAAFRVTRGGKLTCTNINITGGQISIGNNFIVGTDGGVTIKSCGTFEVSSTNFNVSSADKKFQVGAWTLNENGISANINNRTLRIHASSNEYMYFSFNQPPSGASDASCQMRLGLGTVIYQKPESIYPHEPRLDFGVGNFHGMLGDNHFPLSEVWSRLICYWDFKQQSSRFMKNKIIDLPEMGEIIDNLKPVSYEYKVIPNSKRYGLIWEDTINVLSDICAGNIYDEPDRKSINYIDLVSILLKEIQSLRKRVKALEER